MATNERFMHVPPEAVWDALADAGGYGYWVVGSKEIRDADAGWPAPGTRFHHTVGIGPLEVSDHTESLEAERPRRLVIRAKARPLGTARVTLTLTPEDGGTRVAMHENPDGVVAFLAFNPLTQLLLRGRNAESLMRLEELALREAAKRRPARAAGRASSSGRSGRGRGARRPGHARSAGAARAL
jgi:uncharacterized protein YndB with AHSA1/START domain